MCGIAGIFGSGWEPSQLHAMVASQHHRGPDDQGCWTSEDGLAGLGHNRLSIIDLSAAGHQPMWNSERTVAVVFNGEIYNYLELRQQLSAYSFRSRTDTEIILAAWERWGESMLDRFVGMFSLLLWDERTQRLFGARDRFGVKPLYYHLHRNGALFVSSEIKALHRAGAPAAPDETTWATYLTSGASDHSERTFWAGVSAVPAGHTIAWKNGTLRVARWYDLAASAQRKADDLRNDDEVAEEYLGLLKAAVHLRFRSDVPVGINLSGGLDSSLLLGLVHAIQGQESDVKTYTFVTGDPAYDESPWVERMLERTHHPSRFCRLDAVAVPELARSVQAHADEPFGGIPTLAYARLFDEARSEGTVVLLDGQGIDEQWAGYDYYAGALNGDTVSLVQGSSDSPLRQGCVARDFARLAQPAVYPRPFDDALRNMQYRDTCCTKIPRALRFNDRVSMRSSAELREPFLDHRLFELAFRQPVERKIAGGRQKWLVRKLAARLLPSGVVEAPKRPVQTPQREWLRGDLRSWAAERIEVALHTWGRNWLDAGHARQAFAEFVSGKGDNSFFVWQWISIGMMAETHRAKEAHA